jgi:hypothetical protein
MWSAPAFWRLPILDLQGDRMAGFEGRSVAQNPGRRQRRAIRALIVKNEATVVAGKAAAANRS